MDILRNLAQNFTEIINSGQNFIQDIYRDLYSKKTLTFTSVFRRTGLDHAVYDIKREFPKLNYVVTDEHIQVSFDPNITNSYLVELVYERLFKDRVIEEKIQTFGSTIDTISIVHDITSTFPQLICTFCEYENYTKFVIRFEKDQLLESLTLTTLQNLQKELESYDEFNSKKAHQLFQKNLYIDNGTLSKRKKSKTYYIFGNRCVYYKRKKLVCNDRDCDHNLLLGKGACPISKIHFDDSGERETSICCVICGFLTGYIIGAPVYIRTHSNLLKYYSSYEDYYCVDPRVIIVQEEQNHQTIHEFILGRPHQHFQISNRYKIYRSTIMTHKELVVVKYAQNHDHLLALFRLSEIIGEIIIDIRRYIMRFLVLL